MYVHIFTLKFLTEKIQIKRCQKFLAVLTWAVATLLQKQICPEKRKKIGTIIIFCNYNLKLQFWQ
jgi:hypothetical protein